jgi:UDP-glucose 4-epimerase
MKRVLITGANGFIGSHLIDTFLNAGYHVTAGVRSLLRSKDTLNAQCAIVALDYLNPDSLTQTLQSVRPNVVVHCAGVTVANRVSAYEEGNVIPTRNILQALSTQPSTKVILISSLAARGPGITSIDQPLSAYGKSKLKAEKLIMASEFDWSIIRPTAVYGPNDTGFQPLFQWAKRGIFVQLGSSHRKLTFVHVEDVCHQALAAVEETFRISYAWDGQVYSQKQLVAAFQQAAGKRGIVISIPGWLFRSITLSGDLIIRRLLRLPWTYTPEKLKELLAEDWGISDEHTPHQKTIDLPSGFASTYLSYFPVLPS